MKLFTGIDIAVIVIVCGTIALDSCNEALFMLLIFVSLFILRFIGELLNRESERLQMKLISRDQE